MATYRYTVPVVVLTHLIVNILHGQAHKTLGVGLSNWQQIYVVTVILLAPLVALALSFTRYARAALWLLLVSMLGALIFGLCYHYLIISPDHVAHLPAGDARGLFRATALLLLLTEALGVVLAGMAMSRLRFAQSVAASFCRKLGTPQALTNASPGLERSDNPGKPPSRVAPTLKALARISNRFRQRFQR